MWGEGMAQVIFFLLKILLDTMGAMRIGRSTNDDMTAAYHYYLSANGENLLDSAPLLLRLTSNMAVSISCL